MNRRDFLKTTLIANWLGTAPAGKINHDLTDLSEFLPTFAALGDGVLPEGVVIDGQSFAPPRPALRRRPGERLGSDGSRKRWDSTKLATKLGGWVLQCPKPSRMSSSYG